MTAGPAADGTERLLTLVDALVAELRPASGVRARLDSRLDADLGLDSLARVELLGRIEQAFGVRLGDAVLGSAETPRDLRTALAEAAGAAPHDATPGATWQAPTPIAEQRPDTAATLIDVLLWHVDRHPDRIHVQFQENGVDGAAMSYRGLLAAAREVAAGLRREGVLPGECVALMLPSGLEFFHAFYGILLAGAVPVPIYPPTRPGQIEDHLRRQAGILKNCAAVALLGFDAARLVSRILSGLVPSLRCVATPADLRTRATGVAAQGDRRGGADEIAFIQYTSGSTGDPKGVTLDHGNLLANIRAWGEAVDLGPQDVVVSWLPLYHDMGLIGAWLGSLYHACPLVLMSPLDFLARPDRWLRAIHDHRGTVTAAPNFAFELCLRRIEPAVARELDLSSWRYAANGAEPVAAQTLTRFAQAFAPCGFRAEALAPVYGLAECTVGLAVAPPGRGPLIDCVERSALEAGEARPLASGGDAVALVACGRPLPRHELRVVDGDGQVLPPRRVGRIEFRGPSATRGYYRNPGATAQLIRAGWLDSGDLGYLADGDIYLTGRRKDTIIRGGRNLYPYELELAVGAQAGVRRGCVAAFGVVAEGEGTERLVVVAETRETGAAAREDLVRRINALGVELLGAPPDEVVLAPPHSVLKTSSGKIRRAATRERYLGEGFGAAGRAPWRQLVRLGLAGAAQRLLGLAERLGALAYGAWAWGIVAVLLAPTLAVLCLPGLARRWGWLARLLRAAFALCGIRLGIEGAEHCPAPPAVYVANHASYIDGLLVLAALPHPAAFVVKGELATHPLLGPLLRRVGAVFVERFDIRRGVEDVRRLAERDGGGPLFFFAEGTFTPQPGLRPFRLGAFQVAVDTGAPVMPVVLRGTRDLLRDGTWLPRRSGLSVAFSRPLPPAGTDWQAVLALRDATRAAVLAGCGEPDLDRGGG